MLPYITCFWSELRTCFSLQYLCFRGSRVAWGVSLGNSVALPFGLISGVHFTQVDRSPIRGAGYFEPVCYRVRVQCIRLGRSTKFCMLIAAEG